MKNFIKQILMFGGIYFIISFLLGFIYENTNNLYDIILLLLFFICFVILCLKRNFVFLQKIEEKLPKISIFLSSFGMVQYFEIFFVTIPGIVYGYNAARAAYNNVEYASIMPLYLDYAIYVYFSFIILAIIMATYICFAKNKKKNS